MHIEGEMSGQVLVQKVRDNDSHERNIMTEHTKLYTALGRIRELSLVTSTMGNGLKTTTAIIVIVPLGKWTLVHLTAKMARQVLLCRDEDGDPCMRDAMTGHTKLYTAFVGN